MMKNLIWMVGGLCAAAIGVVLWAPTGGRNPSRTQSVEELAHCLQVAWADNHTSL
jgi:hypothetical protein